jgi:hypothetical protein
MYLGLSKALGKANPFRLCQYTTIGTLRRIIAKPSDNIICCLDGYNPSNTSRKGFINGLLYVLLPCCKHQATHWIHMHGTYMSVAQIVIQYAVTYCKARTILNVLRNLSLIYLSNNESFGFYHSTAGDFCNDVENISIIPKDVSNCGIIFSNLTLEAATCIERIIIWIVTFFH